MSVAANGRRADLVFVFAVMTLRSVERVLVGVRRDIDRWFDHAQVHVRRWYTSLDPAMKEWIASTDKAVANGSIWAEIKSQEETRDLVEQWRRGGRQ